MGAHKKASLHRVFDDGTSAMRAECTIDERTGRAVWAFPEGTSPDWATEIRNTVIVAVARKDKEGNLMANERVDPKDGQTYIDSLHLTFGQGIGLQLEYE